MSKPNILFILTDQQTIGAMSASGNAWLSTPAMDSLAGRGVRFTRSWCLNPVSGPSRAGLFTGQTTHQLGVIFNSQFYREDQRTLGHSFRDAGYETPYIGKWHVQQCYPQGREDIPGFDNIAITENVNKALGEEADRLAVQRAKDFLEQKHRKPFFLTVSLLNPHDICYHIMAMHEDALGSYWPQEDDALPPLPEGFAIPEHEPKWLQLRRNANNYGVEPPHTHEWDEKRWRQYLFAYYRMTETVDAHIGTVLESLKKGGHADNTIIVFTSDHGETAAAHQLCVKLNCYEECLSVPLVICDPRHTLQRKVIGDWEANGVDLAPTLLELAGLPAEQQYCGRSLAPALHGKPDPRRYNVSEVYPEPGRPEVTARALRHGDWKYCAYYSDYGFEESLVNLAEDPSELHNLLTGDSEAAHAKRRELIVHLRQWITHTGDSFPTKDLV